MLYDPKWEVKADPGVLTLPSLIAWLEKQPAATTYDYHSSDCVICRYLKANGLHVGNYRWLANSNARMTIGNKAPYTYGAALERARNYSS